MLARCRWPSLGLALAVAAPAQQALRYEDLLARVGSAAWLAWPAPAGERCRQWSSFDRASERGPGDPAAWYANGDRGHYLRVLERAGVREHVLVDCRGPGCVARLWSANPSGTLHVDVDGERVWSVDFAALLAGAVDGVPVPLAGVHARGGTCYLPLPFETSLVLSCTAADLYYTVDVVQFAPGTTVPSFAPTLLVEHRESMQRLTGGLAVGLLPMAAFADDALKSSLAVPVGHQVNVLELRARRALRELPAAARLRVTCGNEVTVDVPWSDFFAAGSAWSSWSSALLEVTEAAARSRWPMPMPEGGRIEVVDDDGRAVPDVGVAVMTVALPSDGPAPLRFHASYHLGKALATRPFRDHLVLDAKGLGRFVGCSLLVRNPSRIWWGEGDEKFTVDGEAFPSWFGTGTEDYFGYAWCDPTPFQAPFHAQIECQGPMNFGFTQLHRRHGLDSVPFTRSFRFDLEVWHWVETAQVDYATVAYWYGAPGATSGLPPVPNAAERALPRLGTPPMFVAEQALEGEELAVAACSGGQHEVQDLGLFEATFSRDRHRFWRGGKVGDELVLTVPVAAAGRYRVSAAFVMADDFAQVALTLGGTALGAPFDGHSPTIRSSGARVLGELDLPAGPAELRLRLVGRHAAAKPGLAVGLDYLLLEPLR